MPHRLNDPVDRADKRQLPIGSSETAPELPNGQPLVTRQRGDRLEHTEFRSRARPVRQLFIRIVAGEINAEKLFEIASTDIVANQRLAMFFFFKGFGFGVSVDRGHSRRYDKILWRASEVIRTKKRR